jgi:hypothetical protein
MAKRLPFLSGIRKRLSKTGKQVKFGSIKVGADVSNLVEAPKSLLERLGLKSGFVEGGKRATALSVIFTRETVKKAPLEAAAGKHLSRTEAKQVRGGHKYLEAFAEQKAASWPRVKSGAPVWPLHWDHGKTIAENWLADHERFMRLLSLRSGKRYWLDDEGVWHSEKIPGAKPTMLSDDDWRFFLAHAHANEDFYEGAEPLETPEDHGGFYKSNRRGVQRSGRHNATGRSVGSYGSGGGRVGRRRVS